MAAVFAIFLSIPVTAGEGKTDPVFAALDAKSLAGLKQALDANPDAWKAKNKVGNQPLHEAARQGNNEAVALLLEHGADVTARGSREWTPLHYPATARNGLKLFKLMFDHLDPAKLSDRQKADVLICGAKNPECLKVVLPAGFDVNLANERKQTALHMAAKYNSAESVRMLLEAGADTGAKDYAGFTPLHNAAENGETENLKLLLEKDASQIDARNTRGETPLMCTSFFGDYAEAAAVLIGKGAKVNAVIRESGGTPLMWAVLRGRLEITRILIKAGADVNFTSDMWSVLGCTAMCGSRVDTGPLEEGFVTGRIGTGADYLRIAELLIEKGADVNREGTGDKKGISMTPLCCALLAGSEPMVKLLLKNGADPEKHNEKFLGNTPLMSAISSSNPKMLELMLGLGVDVNAANNTKFTPLHLAAGLDKPDMVRALIKKGARINARQEDGVTPLMHAVFINAPEGARALLEAGADKTIAMNQGFTPLQVAEKFKNNAMIGILTTTRKSVQSRRVTTPPK